MAEIDPKDFGALEADVRTLTAEVRMLRQEMAQVNAMINQGKGGLYVMLLAAGAIGSGITLFFKKIFG
jgi:multidrug resistance efflux pump